MVKLAGLNVPKTVGRYYTFEGRSPGNLGEENRKGNFPNSTNKKTAGNAPSKGATSN